MDAEEALAKCDKDRNVKNRIGRQLVQLNPINEKESTKEFVNWKGQAANKEISEDYPKTFGRIGNGFITWDLHRLIVCQQAHLLELAVVLRGEFGSLPSRDLVFLRSSGGTGGDVLGAFGPRRHGGEATARRKKGKAWRRRCTG